MTITGTVSEPSYTFEGYIGYDEKSIGNLKFGTFEPKTWTEDDVDIKIAYCGICGSDLHTLRSGWAPTSYPVVVGHEITGTVVRVGKNIKHLRVGDRVGVGAQSGSCLKCEQCKEGHEQYCDKQFIGTYGSPYDDGSISTGGYANYTRVPAHFVIPIPSGIDLADAAPFMCAGVTTYTPLRQNNIGPGSRVGVIGIGGLGHFAIMFAKALGAEVTAISRSRKKETDARQLGATKYIASAEDGWKERFKRYFDVIICTVDSSGFSINDYLFMLKARIGKFVYLGAPDSDISVSLHPFIGNNISLTSNLIGSPSEIQEMFELVREKQLKPIIEVRKLSEVNQALKDMEAGKAHFRYVLDVSK
ncbi:NADP-dependent alcohol dehydrogenase [Schizosaccharomyces japonicus yFS275]|uniref:alcohol dehydrogenase (NADP(+)) n=1 Tax=Schizosaccharomyces japonicus (strain yFS275 / FY16936) TaxID=402676 RepID=B6K2Y8_SCHJY|nr:NADP-dependent alcohol dehydrogenase [Schizosaccharomyces japonicus yFS275]EEB07845.1 NADP-dependent alcohol dehydrogenase [Schizosaccharomyces japonicus yFS275]